MERSVLKKLAKGLYESGVTFGGIVEAVEKQTGDTISKGTLHRWKEKGDWQKKAQAPLSPTPRRITPLADNFEDMAKRIDTVGQDIATIGMESIRALAIAQTKITATLEEFPDTIPTNQIRSFTDMVKAQVEIGKSVSAIWQTVEVAGRIGEFMAENIAIDIEFEEYESSELPQYEKEDAPDN